MPRLVPFLIFLLVALSLVGGMHYYIWLRLVRDPHLPQAWARGLTVAIVALGITMPATVIAARLLGSSVVRPAIWLAFIWMGVGFLLVAFLGIADFGRLVA
ncbi:MAG TPA: metallophosphoesterase, partial [Myxococcales bacterium]|nr:metallophosphoesterase [Myxococcales bacterium]